LFVAYVRWFENTAIILFLNKMDLFAEKIKVKSVRQPNPIAGEPDLFADYTGTVCEQPPRLCASCGRA
jgi:hypothetical protein